MAYLLLICGALILAIGLYTFLRAPRKLVHRLFLLFAGGFAVWSAGLGMIFLTGAPLYNQVVLLTIFPVFGGLFLFVSAYPDRTTLSWSTYGAAIPILLLALAAPSGLFVSGIQTSSGAPAPVNGPGIWVFAGVALCYALASAAIFALRLGQARGMRRMQMLYLATALGLCVSMAITGDLILPAFGVFYGIVAGPLSLIVCSALIAYAIVRHELMDIKVIIRQGLVYGLLLALVGGIYMVLVGALGFFFGTTAYTIVGSAALTAFGVAFATPLITRARLYQEAQRHAAELERKVEERTRELREEQENQRQMMLNVSHGLQTPLAVFQTKLEQLKRTMPGAKDLQQFETSLADLSNFIQNLLKLAHLEHTREQIALTPVCLTSLLGEIAEEVETIAATHDISVRQKIALDIYVRGDAKKIRDVVMNLASNAIKYMRLDGKKEITFSLATEEDAEVLYVSDTGVGIAPEDLPHVFDRFYRVKNSPYRISGSGLGLAISKRIVEQHGGTLAAESELGQGTTVTMRLPIIMA